MLLRVYYGVFAIFALSLLSEVFSGAIPDRSPSTTYEFHPIQSIAANPQRNTEVSTTRLKRAFDFNAHSNLFAVVAHLGSGWFVSYNRLDYAFSNVVVVSAELISFYSNALSLAGHVWANEEPQTSYRVVQGGLTLTLTSMAPISFEFLHGFFLDAVRSPRILFINHLPR